MDTAMQILVVILSTFLAIFLVLSIALLVLLIRVTRTIRRIADQADHAIDNVQAAASAVKNAAGPLAVGRFLMNIVETFQRKERKTKD